jgi:arsenate reductase
VSNILFVCLHNAGRSQMSEALFARIAGKSHASRSAGTSPAKRVHPAVVTAMRELDIDLSSNTPAMLTTELAQWADVVITMGCGDACPVIPGKRYIDWELPDPKDMPIEKVREVRDDIDRRVRQLVKSLDRV